MRRVFAQHTLAVISVLAVTLLVISCKKSDNNVNMNPAVSGLMAVNLATDKAVDVTLSGNSITNLPLAFTNYTGTYLSVYSGPRLVQSFDYNSGASLDSATFTFDPQKYYSLFVTGFGGHYKNIIVNDNFDSLNTQQAYLRYVNAIADSAAPTVIVSANGESVSNATAGFGTVSNFAPVAPGQVTIQVSNGGSINKSRTVTVSQQKAYTFLLAGNPASTGNDSLQIRYIENGTFTQSAQKSATAGSASTK